MSSPGFRLGLSCPCPFRAGTLSFSREGAFGLKAFSFCTTFGQSCFFYSVSAVTGGLCCLDHQPMRPPRWDPLFSGSLKLAFGDSDALIHCQPSFWLSSAKPGRTRICFLPGRALDFRQGILACRRICLRLLREPCGLYVSVGALRGRIRQSLHREPPKNLPRKFCALGDRFRHSLHREPPKT